MKIVKGLSLATALLAGSVALAQGTKAADQGAAKPAASEAMKQDSGKMGKMGKMEKGMKKGSKGMKKDGKSSKKADSTAKGTKKPGQ